MSNAHAFQHSMALFDAANAEDPHTEHCHGEVVTKELQYSQRMSEMLSRFAPEASEAVLLACRAQHIQRWKIPRSDYPMTREGYQTWRTTLYKFHAETCGNLMQQAGYDDAMIERVRLIVGKRGLKINAETQMMEDVASLVFIEHYMADFAAQKKDYNEEKWLTIIQKTWKKMSHSGREFALSGKLNLPQTLVPLILKAVQP